jgi:hypothetical protein
MSLPTSRQFVTRLLDSLPSSSSNTDAAANPLSAVPESAKNQLLSLQVLFPNEFLPALDLLDRGLVTRLRIHDGAEGAAHAEEEGRVGAEQDTNNSAAHGDDTMADIIRPPANESIQETIDDQAMTDANLQGPEPTPSKDCTYYVRSAQQRSSRYSTSYDTTTSYEVRLRAWNCSCPAFAFAAFPAVHPEPAISTYSPNDTAMEGLQDDGAWSFGGVSLGNAIPPVCKHLLACVLVEKCSGLFGSFVEEKMVSVEEAAGWAAGWGD